MNIFQENNPESISNKYILSEILSKGSFGTVYYAENMNKEKVIIKIIEKKKDRAIDKIRRDSEIPKLIKHKNIVEIIDFIENDGFAYIIYPYIENSKCLSDLPYSDLNFEKKEKLIHMINMMCQICDAIQFIHSKNVVHRDIKPDNIIISDSVAFLIDFDLSFVYDNPRYPLVRGIKGTPFYIAPELWRNDSNINYPLTDIYSFGITLYFIFNKKKIPYDADSFEELEDAICYEQPLQSKSGIPKLDKLIMKIIDKQPTNRPDIYEIKTSLQKIIISDRL